MPESEQAGAPCLNGIDGTTGDYLLSSLNCRDISSLARGERIGRRHARELKFWLDQTRAGKLGPVAGVDPGRIEEAGWGVIFSHAASPALREAIQELLDWRKVQATRNGNYYREYFGEHGVRPGESKLDFLARHGAGPGPADPNVVPYYLLIVADPNEISFRFQYQLDVQYAVGRVWFDTLDEYSHYARAVIAEESQGTQRSRTALFFGVHNPDDKPTELSTTQLIIPLADQLRGTPDTTQIPWKIETVIGSEATKSRFGQLIGGADGPAFLFSASHGLGFARGDLNQTRDQGALVCRDWPGPLNWGRRPLSSDHYYAADDVPSDASPRGLIAFFFACYSAGTPLLDDYPYQRHLPPNEIAPHAFIANLPRRLLGHRRGGALAVIGHVERAWSCSFLWRRAGRQLQTYRAIVKQLLDGYPVGAALEFMNQKFAEYATELTSLQECVASGQQIDDSELVGLWSAHNDSRSYIIVGDPAVRLGRQSPGHAKAASPASPTST